MNSTDIIFFSSSDWDWKWGSRQQVALRLATRGYRVLFVEHMAGVEHVFKYRDLRQRRFRRRQDELVEIQRNLWLLTPPLLLPGRYYWSGIATLNAMRIVRWSQPYLRRLNFRNPILWLYKPEHSKLIGRWNESVVVYHCIDEFTVGTSGHKRRVIRNLETELLYKANVVFANSHLTYVNKRRFNLHTYQIPSGADAAHFSISADSTGPAAYELSRLPHPQLVFMGNINEKINIPLLNEVVKQRPDWTLVLIGPVNGVVPLFDELCTRANVHYLGKRRYAELPTLLRSADLCLLPYVQGEASRYRSPLKLYEYLATGKPIVSVPHPEVEQFKKCITIAPHSEFVYAIENTLATDTHEKQACRMAVALQHTWDIRVDRMIQFLNEELAD